MINEEKQKALEAALGHIEKQYGKGSVYQIIGLTADQEHGSCFLADKSFVFFHQII